MKNISYLVYRFLFFLVPLTTFIYKSSSATIQLQLNPAPPSIQESVKQELISTEVITNKLNRLSQKDPDRIGKKLLKNGFKKIAPKISGFTALYGGYVDYSDNEGTITFPLLHEKPKTYIVITSDIDLVNIHGETISHRKLLTDKPAKIYKLERKEDNQKVLYWQVTEKIPKNKNINPISIVLLTKPKNIVVPTGDFIATENQSLVLPNIYVVGNIDNAKTLLDFLDIRKYFEQIERKTKKATDKVRQTIMENL